MFWKDNAAYAFVLVKPKQLTEQSCVRPIETLAVEDADWQITQHSADIGLPNMLRKGVKMERKSSLAVELNYNCQCCH